MLFLHALTLWAFAVAQPVYDISAQYPDLLIAHGVHPLDVIVLVLSISLGAPFFIASAVWLIGYIHKSIQKAAYLIFVCLMVAAFVLPILKKIEILSDTLMAVAALLVSIGFVVSYISSKTIQKIISYLSIAVVIFPLYFVGFSPVRQLVFAKDTPKDVVSKLTENPVPVVMIIYDELPLVSLMDEKHRIDPIYYPNFAKLSADAYWFRNFTVHAPATEYTIPAMVTGRYAIKADLPLTAEAYPETLFTLLGSRGYRVVPLGIVDKMCPEAYRDKSLYHAPARDRVLGLVLDTSMVYLHIIAPHRLSARLPAVDSDWNNFVSIKRGGDDLGDQFIESLSPSLKNSLYVLKLHDVHNPWQKLPSGKIYTRNKTMPGYNRDRDHSGEKSGFGAKVWSGNEWLVVQGYQRHLLCVQAADTLLGRMIDALKTHDLYDDALIIVTSDHGCAFRPKQRNRGNRVSVRTDTLPVPFIMKLPNQHEGIINDENVEAMDVLPTVADILDIEVPWRMDGRSVFDPQTSPRKVKRFYWRGHRFTYDAANAEKYDSLKKKLEIFGSGATRPHGLFQIGPYGDLVGQPTAAFISSSSSIEICFNERSKFKNVDVNDPEFAPCYISGSIPSPSPIDKPVHMAIGVNGKIQAVTQTYREGTTRDALFYAIIPEEALKPGKNDIMFFEILPETDGPIRLAAIQVKGKTE